MKTLRSGAEITALRKRCEEREAEIKQLEEEVEKTKQENEALLSSQSATITHLNATLSSSKEQMEQELAEADRLVSSISSVKAELSAPTSDPADTSPDSMSAQLRQLVRSNLSTTKSCISLESTIATAKEKQEANAKRQQTLQEALTGTENITDEVEKKKKEVEEKKYEMEMNENAVSAK